MSTDTKTDFNIDRSVGDFRYDVDYSFDAGVGLTEKTIDYIADVKNDPEWIRAFRKEGYRKFLEKPMPTHWASHDLDNIIFENIRYYLSQGTQPKRSWDDVPDDVKRTFERLGIPEQERKFLAGVEAQFDSEAAYSNIKKAVGDQGVIFVGSTDGLQKHPEIFRKWFGKVIPSGDNKFSALNSAVFSGGSFIYIPPGVKVKHPLQAYFRINAENFGQFERTLIIADEGSEVMYMEGCTAPKFETSTLHSAVVELVAMPSMYFRLGGGTVKGVSKPGWIVWSRVYIADGKLKYDTGLAEVVALPKAETAERWKLSTPQWPIMHAVLKGITRDQMMARHQANHIQVVYGPDKAGAKKGLYAKAAAMHTLGLEVALCGDI